MHRRAFTKGIAWAGAIALGGLSARSPKPKQKVLKPRRLKRGDLVGLISPGSYVDDEGLEKAVKNLESLGLIVKQGENIRKERGYTAGTDEERLEDLHAMFEDRAVKGVWCVRGGYGCTRLLPQIDYKLIKKNPKVLIGYSDITALIQAIQIETGLVSFHGPVGASDFTDYSKEQLVKVLMDPEPGYGIPLSLDNNEKSEPEYQQKVISGGKAEGILAGGNLSILASLAGTPWALNASDKLLFLEDVGERPYRIDRMLTQLRQASHLKQANGFLLGVFADCEAQEGSLSLSLQEALNDRLAEFQKPTFYGWPFGHIKNQCTFPVGMKASLDVEAKKVVLEEMGVI